MASCLSILVAVLAVHVASIVAGDYGGYGGYGGYHYGNKPVYGEGPAHAKPHYNYGNYHYAKTTCADHYKPGIKNGFFKVYSASAARSMKVYCDFQSEPGTAYTMVMASNAAGRTGLDGAKFTDISLASLNVGDDVNPYAPNFFAYRQKLSDMKRIKSASKMFRYTCGSESPAPVLFSDLFIRYLRVTLSTDADPLKDHAGECVNAAFVRAGDADGDACSNCQVSLQQASTANGILHVSGSDSCTDTPKLSAVTQFVPTSNAGECNELVILWFGKAVH